MAKKPAPYKSGICSFAKDHSKCWGEFKNGSLAEVKVTLCHCECHKNK